MWRPRQGGVHISKCIFPEIVVTYLYSMHLSSVQIKHFLPLPLSLLSLSLSLSLSLLSLSFSPLSLFSPLFSGYYQHPEVVQFTEIPSDAVVCEGCRLEMSCSILQQETAANLPLPELEWIFNGRRLSEVRMRHWVHSARFISCSQAIMLLLLARVDKREKEC